MMTMADCPKCGASIYEEAQRCPKCGDYVTPGSDTRRAWPWWMSVGMILALIIAFGLAFS